jgi:uncharacterized protein (TIGR01370 family)
VTSLAILISLAALMLCSQAAWAGSLKQRVKNWLVYYGDQADPGVIAKFDLVALDADHHPPLVRRGPKAPLFLGYVSLGEAEPHRYFYNKVKGGSMLVGRNEDWNADLVDVRSLRWQNLLLDKVIPKIMAQGFDGLFLDTLDSAVYLELYKDPVKFAGMKRELVNFIAKIRARFPHALLCANRGREIWEQAAPYLDFVVLEDFSTSYDFKTKKYLTLSPQDIAKNLDFADRAIKANPEVMPLAIDYVEPDDVEAAGRAISLAAKYGLITYVSDLQLDEVYLYTLNKK